MSGRWSLPRSCDHRRVRTRRPGVESDQSVQVTPRQPSDHCRSMGADDSVALPSTERPQSDDCPVAWLVRQCQAARGLNALGAKPSLSGAASLTFPGVGSRACRPPPMP
jgi:hypothetical protein